MSTPLGEKIAKALNFSSLKQRTGVTSSVINSSPSAIFHHSSHRVRFCVSAPAVGVGCGPSLDVKWQEATVIICHALPALALMAAWVLLVWGIRGAFRNDRALSSGGVA